MVLGHVNRTAWGTKLLLTVVLAFLVDCISLCHLLKAKHSSLSPNWCFTPPSAPHPPPYPPHAPPTNLISRERGLEFCFWPKQMDIVISTSKLSSAKQILTKQLASDSFVAEDGSGRL